MRQLTGPAREEIALALLLWRDFKSEGKFEVEIVRQMLELADYLGVRKELDELMPKLPPMKVSVRG